MAGFANNILRAFFPTIHKKGKVHNSISTDSKRILKEDTPFAITEAYRALYTNILYLPIESKTKKIAVFSAVPGEGKTTVSVNLAYTIAANSTESKVIIIDADMRKPRVASLIGYSGKKLSGLSEYLAGIDETPSVVSTKYDNLSFLPSGAVNANSPALLSTGRMKKLIETLEEEYDFIIFDTPPINVVSDALMLSDYVDGYIMSVKSEFSDYNSISDAIARFEASEAKLFGFVLNAYSFKSSKRNGKYYRYGKKYGQGYGYGYGYGYSDNENKDE